ncbi:MAG: hypothetical protein SV253_00630 [Halobacteria archaeon]|nr:hypothetical protein [Halobacteria archaeon]
MVRKTESVSDLLDLERPPEDTPLRSPRVESYSWETFKTTTRKTANLIAGLGVRRGHSVSFSPANQPESVFFFLGASLLGAEVTAGLDDDVSPELVFGPTPTVERLGLGTRGISYGEKPDDPRLTHYEREIWGESPLFPPDRTSSPEDVVLVDGSDEYRQSQLFEAAETVADEAGIHDYDEAVVGSVSEPRDIVAGVLAPLVAETTVTLRGDASRGTDTDTDADTDSDAVLLRRGDTQKTLRVGSVSIK